MEALRSSFAGVLTLALLGPGHAQDAEASTHTDTASRPQVSFEQRQDGWVVRQYQLGCLSLLSYLVVAGDTAVVIDPQRDVEHYLADAKALGATVRHVLLTHPHADFVAGHTELAHATGATIHLSELAGASFPHHALRDGDRLAIGLVTFTAWATPGHTPNAMTFLLQAPGAKVDPAFAFTGDTLFVGSIGRPDLLDVPPTELAAASFASVQRLKGLPDGTVVLPAHGAGSLCGAHLSPDTTSTIGREKATNPYLRIGSQATFVANVVSHQPVAPAYFAFNVALNRSGPPRIDRDAPLPPLLSPAAVQALLGPDTWLVDLRDQTAYAKAHVAGAVNVALRGRLDTWTGIVVPFGAQLVLVGDDASVAEGAFRLRRIGYDQPKGRLAVDPAAWRAAGLPVRSSQLVTPAELHAAMQQGSEPLVIDVRTAEEYADLRLGDVGNIPVTDSERFAKVLAKDTPALMVCNSAYRSSMAVGLAERLGLTAVASLDGGLDAWVAAGLPVQGRMAKPAPAGIVLPEVIDAPLLARALLDAPATYTVLDLRPAWMFAEWHLPGASNVALDGLAARIAELPADARIVLVDRDGTTAFAAAGALLASNPGQPLRVLLGGLQQYHRTIVLGGDAAPAATTMPTPSPTANPAPAPTPTAKKRNAGC